MTPRILIPIIALSLSACRADLPPRIVPVCVRHEFAGLRADPSGSIVRLERCAETRLICARGIYRVKARECRWGRT